MRLLSYASDLLSGAVDPDYVPPPKEKYGPEMNHPLFTANIPAIAAAFGVKPNG